MNDLAPFHSRTQASKKLEWAATYMAEAKSGSNRRFAVGGRQALHVYSLHVPTNVEDPSATATYPGNQPKSSPLSNNNSISGDQTPLGSARTESQKSTNNAVASYFANRNARRGVSHAASMARGGPSRNSLSSVAGSQMMTRADELSNSYHFKCETNLVTKPKVSHNVVRFHPGSDGVIAAGSSNGYIHMWDLNVPSSASNFLAKWSAHTRAINTICFLPQYDVNNARNTNYPATSDIGPTMSLLSASADGACKHWLLPDPVAEVGQPLLGAGANLMKKKLATDEPFFTVTEMRPERTNRSPIRSIDVQLQTSGKAAAILTATDDGRVSLYDNGLGPVGFSNVNQLKAWKVSADPLYGVRFHPYFGNIFAAAGRDKKINVFDIRNPSSDSESRRLSKPAISVGTTHSISATRWRPDSTGNSFFIATVASVMSNAVQLWDLRFPTLPYYEFNSHARGDAVSDFFWASSDHIVSAGKDETIRLHGIDGAVQNFQYITSRKVCFSATGELFYFQQEVPRKPAHPVASPKEHPRLLHSFPEVAMQKDFQKDLPFKKVKEESRDFVSISGLFPSRSFFHVVTRELKYGVWTQDPGADENILPKSEKDFYGEGRGCSMPPECAEVCRTWSAWAKRFDFPNHAEHFTGLADIIDYVDTCDHHLATTVSSTTSGQESAASISDQNKEMIKNVVPPANNYQPALEETAGVEDTESVVTQWRHTWKKAALDGCLQTFRNLNDLGMVLVLLQIFRYNHVSLGNFAREAVNLLSREGMFHQHAIFIKFSPHECIKSMSHKSALQAQFSRDSRKLKPPPGTCSICNQPVHRMWIGCPACLHGGHMSCIREWFQYNNVCPEGCGCKCHSDLWRGDTNNYVDDKSDNCLLMPIGTHLQMSERVWRPFNVNSHQSTPQEILAAS